MSPLTISSTCTKRGSAARRAISSAACTGSRMHTVTDARSRGSLSSHSAASQSFTARASAAPMSSPYIAIEPCRQFRMPMRVFHGSSACARSASTVAAGRSTPARQSGRALSGAPGG